MFATPPATVVATQVPAKSGGGAIDAFVLLILGGLALGRVLQQRRTLGQANDDRAGDFAPITNSRLAATDGEQRLQRDV